MVVADPFAPLQLHLMGQTGIEESEWKPELHAQPNPFEDELRISFTLPLESETQLIVYDILGREIVVLENSRLPVGDHDYTWLATSVSKGVYFIKLATQNGNAIRQIIKK